MYARACVTVNAGAVFVCVSSTTHSITYVCVRARAEIQHATHEYTAFTSSSGDVGPGAELTVCACTPNIFAEGVFWLQFIFGL